MALVMTEVAALAVLEKIKKFEASMTWPHPSGEGYTSAIFLTLESGKPYLLYVPQSKVAAVYTKDELNDWSNSNLLIAEQFKIEYYLYEGPDTSSSSNTIAFTFRPSRLSTPVTYVLKVGAQL